MKIKNIVGALSVGALALFSSCEKRNPIQEPDPSTENEPAVEATSPANNAEEVALNKIVSVSFNQAMDATTFNTSTFTVKQGNTAVAGLITYAALTATFKPNVAFQANTTYTVTITKTVSNEKGKKLSADVVWDFKTGVNATGMKKIDLGTAANFVILAKTAINNNPTSVVTGNIGISPAAATFITGFSLVDATGYATSAQITGKAFAADMAVPTSSNLTVAVGDMITAYNDAAGRSNPDFNELANGNLGGKTLVPGLYKWDNTVIAPTNFVISGSETDIWIFQVAGNLTVSSGVNMVLSGGAKPENIFWQVAGEVTLKSTANLKGIILSMTGITLQTGAVFTGRALAQTAVILDANAVTQP